MNKVYQARITSGVIVGIQIVAVALLLRFAFGFGWDLTTVIRASLLAMVLGIILYWMVYVVIDLSESFAGAHLVFVSCAIVMIPYVLLVAGFGLLAYIADLIICVHLIEMVASKISPDDDCDSDKKRVWRALAMPQFCFLAVPPISIGIFLLSLLIHDLFRH